MNLDDQLRSAHERRLASTRARLANEEFDTRGPHEASSEQQAPKLSTRVLTMAAALLIFAGVGWALVSPLGNDGSVEIEVGSGGQELEGETSNGGDSPDDDAAADSDTSDDSNSDDSNSDRDNDETLVVEQDEQASDPEPVAEQADDSDQAESTVTDDDTSSSDTSGGEDGDSGSEVVGGDNDSPTTVSTSPNTTAAPETTVDENTSSLLATEVDPGVAIKKSVCASGLRAPLERASLRYVSENTGWMRMINLVDEQDEPFYFKGWEPGYKESVTVELGLAKPVWATEIKLAQHPELASGGLIAVGVPGGGFNIELDGIGGWKTHRFDEPVLLEAFTLNRQDEISEVMEVIVCVDSR